MLVKVSPGIVLSDREILPLEASATERPSQTNHERMVREAAICFSDALSGLRLQAGSPIRLTLSANFEPIREAVGLAIGWRHGSRAGQLVLQHNGNAYICGDGSRVKATRGQNYGSEVVGVPLEGNDAPFQHAFEAVSRARSVPRTSFGVPAGALPFPIAVATGWMLGFMEPTRDATLVYKAGRLLFGTGDITRLGRYVEGASNSESTSAIS